MKQKILLLAVAVIISLVLMAIAHKNTSKVQEETSAPETQVETTEEQTEPATTVDIYELKAEECLQRQIELSVIEDEMEWFVAYKALIEEYIEWVDAPLTVYDLYTEEEIRYMLKCVETEVHGKNFISKCNIASVILNRLDRAKEGVTAVDIVTSPNQFAYGRDDIEDSTVLALEYVCMVGRTTYEALYFRSDVKLDVWRGNIYLFTDQAGHHFYAPAVKEENQ